MPTMHKVRKIMRVARSKRCIPDARKIYDRVGQDNLKMYIHEFDKCNLLKPVKYYFGEKK